MKTISRISQVRSILKPLRKERRIGFVPTMGAFHDGHLFLMKQARKECDMVVASLFVNPLQFGPKEDFAAYPRTLEADRKKAASAGIDLLWTPSAEEIYPAPYQTYIDVEGVSRRWEGASRPGHFRGVATVVAKLFQVIRPDRAYFGQKDYQQTRVIGQMVRDLHFDLTLRILPTVREPDGLAMSSRNRRLSPEEREKAPLLYKALRRAEALVRRGERGGKRIEAEARGVLQSEPGLRLDYLALCDPETLEPLDRLEKKGVLLLAAEIGPVRLIDNIIFDLGRLG